MKVIVYRGAEEIGGNCIELRSSKSRILLDYGAPLPKIDHVTHKSIPPTPEETILNIPGLYESSPMPISGLLISHTHPDHYGGLLPKPINPGVKVFMTEIMEDMIRITNKMPREAQSIKADIHYFRKGHKFIVGNFVVTPYLMDHSASESFAFLIECEGKRLIYTGDYREHGNKVTPFRQFLAADMGRVDLLITEGTQALVEKGPTEHSVMEDIELLARGKGTLYVMCSGQNVDLLSSLASIAERTSRYLVVDGYVALVLERLKGLARKQGLELKIPGLDKGYLKVIDNKATQKISQLTEYAETYARIRAKIVSWDWVRTNVRRLIIPVRAYSHKWVDEQIKDIASGALVYSLWEGYREEEGFAETLAYFKAHGLTDVPIHSSGHAYFSAVRKLVENKKPLNIIPVHTEHPEKFAETFGSRVRLLKNGGEFEL